MRKNKKTESDEQARQNKLDGIKLSTGNVNKKYVVRDIVFAADRVEIDLFSADTNPNDVFSGVYQKLKELAYDYEADAVINCHFEERYASYNGTWVTEIFAYGTVVQFTQTTIG